MVNYIVDTGLTPEQCPFKFIKGKKRKVSAASMSFDSIAFSMICIFLNLPRGACSIYPYSNSSKDAVMPVSYILAFAHNILIIKQKYLLEVEQVFTEIDRIPFGGGRGIRTRYTFHESMSSEFSEILVLAVMEIILL